jgi:iron complex transport system substrate-binding protein
MLRIASLLPSTTEIACALGFRDALVGRSHECDFPVGVETLPVLTEAELDARAASRAIDDRVKQLVGEGLSVYRVDAEKLRALAPDVILTQAQCEVCAASLSDVEAALADWTGARPQVVSLQPATLGDVWGDFERVAAALGDASLDTREFGLPVIRLFGLLKVDPVVRVRFHLQGTAPAGKGRAS